MKLFIIIDDFVGNKNLLLHFRKMIVPNYQLLMTKVFKFDSD